MSGVCHVSLFLQQPYLYLSLEALSSFMLRSNATIANIKGMLRLKSESEDRKIIQIPLAAKGRMDSNALLPQRTASIMSKVMIRAAGFPFNWARQTHTIRSVRLMSGSAYRTILRLM